MVSALNQCSLMRMVMFGRYIGCSDLGDSHGVLWAGHQSLLLFILSVRMSLRCVRHVLTIHQDLPS